MFLYGRSHLVHILIGYYNTIKLDTFLEKALVNLGHSWSQLLQTIIVTVLFVESLLLLM